MRIIGFCLLLVSVILLSGCLGDTRHSVETTGNGSLLGLGITPEPQALSISTNEEFDLDWTCGYEPPAEFRVKLEEVDSDGTRTGVLTVLHTHNDGHYTLEPTFYLPHSTFLLLTVSGDGSTVRSMYLTEHGFPSTAPTTRKAPGTEEGQVEHVVKIGK